MLAILTMEKSLYLNENNSATKIQSWKESMSPLLRQHATLHLKQSALMIIDMQHYFLDERSHAFIPTGVTVMPNIHCLLTLFRDEGLPVIFTRFALKEGEYDPIGNWWGQSVHEGSRDSAIVEELEPRRREKVLRKTSYDSFYGTDLEEYLRSNNVKDVIIAGVLTNLCCESTAREAFTRGFSTFFVMDATATFNESLHLASLINLSCGFATPLTTEEIINQHVVQ